MIHCSRQYRYTVILKSNARHIGKKRGYLLPSEGANNIALAMFTFPSLAEYEQYREKSLQDTACIAAFKYAEETKCIMSYERTFFRPVFNG